MSNTELVPQAYQSTSIDAHTDRLATLTQLKQRASVTLARGDQMDGGELSLYALAGFNAGTKVPGEIEKSWLQRVFEEEFDKGTVLRQETGDLDLWILERARMINWQKSGKPTNWATTRKSLSTRPVESESPPPRRDNYSWPC